MTPAETLRTEWATICEAMNRGTYRGTEADALARIEAIKREMEQSERRTEEG